jgi:ATP-dependent DNA helicase RecG
MTATPIPRTVALTLYGELDLSVIDEMPKGRLPVKTFLVPKAKRESGYLWIKKKIKEERTQVFIICPLIEESEVETMKSVKAAKKEFERLQKEVFPEFKLGMLHGKIKAKEKETVMRDFKEGKYHILVATPVVEVGIDVANATLMLVEGAERFGLAQLHQLRGRVGRGSVQSYCFLYTESTDVKVLERLSFFAKSTSGMQVAEHDLKVRGPGEVFGTRQHGYLDLKVASLSDYQLIDKSKHAVNYFLDKYRVNKFPEIKKRLEGYRVKQISRD